MDTKQRIRSQRDARRQFWNEAPPEIQAHYRSHKSQNDYPTDVRVAWCDWVNAAARAGRMSERIAQAVTL